jgi:hypothetical protein
VRRGYPPRRRRGQVPDGRENCRGRTAAAADMPALTLEGLRDVEVIGLGLNVIER